jgi:hypothetical protein
MQIKTITCHEVYNHGASLQEYALLSFLNANGFEAQTIHYKPSYLSKHFNLLSVDNPKFDKPVIKQMYLLAKLPNRLKGLKRKKAFDVFASKYIPTDTTKYTTNEELKNNLPSADAYICGSDQIWNSFFENGKDPAFYLDFVPEDKLKISYAASFATDTIAADLRPFVTEKVKRIDYISVRETSALEILKDLGITNAKQVLDPVFLLPQSHWLQFVFPIQEDFVFIYDFDSNPTLKKMALDYKVKHNVKIYTVNQNIDYADKNFYFEGPETFLSLMYHSKFVFTNSFHSVAFSLIFQKQFAVFDRNEKINTRMRDLLGLFQIKNLITESISIEELNKIDYALLNSDMVNHVNKANIFLLNIKKYV